MSDNTMTSNEKAVDVNGITDEKAQLDTSKQPPNFPETDEPLFDLPINYEHKPWPELTPEQQEKLKALREFAESIALPQSDPYYENEQQFLNDNDVTRRFGDTEKNKSGTYRRYLRAAKWNLEDSKKRLKFTMEWRREYKPDLIKPEEIEMEAFTGKMLILGYDNQGRPMLYLRPSLENTPTDPRQLRHVTFILERLPKLMPLGVDTITIVADYKQSKAGSTPSVNTGIKTLSLLQNHYPERLGLALAVNLPWFVTAFFKLITPFMDPVTREKLKFNVPLADYVPTEQLYIGFSGGQYNYVYNHDKYWTALLERTWWVDGGKYERLPKDTK